MTRTLIKSATRQTLRGSLATVRVVGKAAVYGVRTGLRHTQRLPDIPELPPGRWIDLPGRGEMFVIDSGAPRPGAPTLLLLHGLATTSYLTWFSTMKELAAEHRIVMLDQRWHGQGIVSDRFSIEECADDAAAALDALGIEQVVAVGYSLGGALAQVFWHRHRERVAGLVLASTAGWWRANIGDAFFYPMLGFANKRFHDHYRAQVTLRRSSLEDNPATGGEMSTWAWTEFRRTSAWVVPEVLGVLGSFDTRAWLGQIDVPTAVVVTTRDHAIPASRQRALAAAIPDASVHESPGGHASVVFDVHRWRPVFLAAVAEVVERCAN